MKVSDKGLIELVCSEGIVPYPYLDSVGVWTYGIGHTKGAGAPDPAAMAKGAPTSLAACIELFRKDLVKYENAVLKAVKVPLKPHEFDALVHWHYNTGAIASATLTKKLNAGDRKGAAAQFLVWNKPAELTPRREKERKLFEQGVYSNNGKALVYTADSTGRLGKATSQNVSDLLWLVPANPALPIIKVEDLPTAPVLPAAFGVSPPGNMPAYHYQNVPYSTASGNVKGISDPTPPAVITRDEPIKPPGFWSSLFVVLASAFKRK